MSTTFHIGTSGYAYKEWKGPFYPEDLPAKRMLSYYAERFGTVEMNSSFYRLPTVDAVKGWAAEAPAGFRFALKAPQRITHFKRLKEAGEPLAAFVGVAAALGERLGPLFFQLPPNMKKDAARLADFLALVPPGRRVAFEFRHQSWFDEETYGVLRGAGAALVIAEAEEGESGDVDVPFVATAGWGYVRLRKNEYRKPALKKWVERMRGAGWTEAFVYFMHEDTGTGPKFAAQMMELV